jgi:hypothetical protein
MICTVACVDVYARRVNSLIDRRFCLYSRLVLRVIRFDGNSCTPTCTFSAVSGNHISNFQSYIYKH